jgi:hypothetical protein
VIRSRSRFTTAPESAIGAHDERENRLIWLEPVGTGATVPLFQIGHYPL